MSELLRDLLPRTPRRVLEELAPIAKALDAHGRARPIVTLLLGNGQSIRGGLLAVAETREGIVATLWVDGPPAAPAVAFVPVGSVLAVIVDDAAVLVKPPLSDTPAPPRLELARMAQAKADALASALGHPVQLVVDGALDDDARRAVAGLIPTLVDVLTKIAADEMGKDALAPITSVELVAGSPADAWKDGAKLVVRAPTLLTDPFSPQKLREKLEALL
ncbi:MAG TPA: hypothetical protein VGM88_21490 [Kofleriaceae bacterium]